MDASDRLRNLVEQIEHADQVGLDVFGIGEHHRREYLDSAPTVTLGAAAVRTHRIRLTSAVTVLSSADPIRVFQNFATLDLLSQGRAEMVVGRGSFIESFPLFGLKLEDYDSLFVTDVAKSLFERKSGLLLSVRQIWDHGILKPVRKPNRRVRNPDKLEPSLRTGGWVYNHRRS